REERWTNHRPDHRGTNTNTAELSLTVGGNNQNSNNDQRENGDHWAALGTHGLSSPWFGRRKLAGRDHFAPFLNSLRQLPGSSQGEKSDLRARRHEPVKMPVSEAANGQLIASQQVDQRLVGFRSCQLIVAEIVQQLKD